MCFFAELVDISTDHTRVVSEKNAQSVRLRSYDQWIILIHLICLCDEAARNAEDRGPILREVYFMKNVIKLFTLVLFMTASQAYAANAPNITGFGLSNARPGDTGFADHYFPKEDIGLFVRLSGNPNYLVNDPNNQGGGWIDIYSNGQRIIRNRINSTNTPIDFTVLLVICPAVLCGYDHYGPFQFGSNTFVEFMYHVPAALVGNYALTVKFTGDDFTSSTSTQPSYDTTVRVSCEPKHTGRTIVYPPPSSGCP